MIDYNGLGGIDPQAELNHVWDVKLSGMFPTASDIFINEYNTQRYNELMGNFYNGLRAMYPCWDQPQGGDGGFFNSEMGSRAMMIAKGILGVASFFPFESFFAEYEMTGSMLASEKLFDETATGIEYRAIESSAAESSTTVIGEGMARVEAAASKIPGSKILNDMPTFTGTADQITSQMMQYNRQWILNEMRSGRTILDIGLDVNRTNSSIFYQMEQNMLKNYQILYPNSLNIIIP